MIPKDKAARILRSFQGQAETRIINDHPLDRMELTAQIAFVCEILADSLEGKYAPTP